MGRKRIASTSVTDLRQANFSAAATAMLKHSDKMRPENLEAKDQIKA